MKFTSEAGDRAFRDAIKAIESVSSAEVVVAVRAYARRWMVQHLIVGLVSATAVLGYTLLFDLPPWAVFAFPIVTGLVSGSIVELITPLYRFLVPAHIRDQHVVDTARALFVERRIHGTKGRTGMLVFIAVRERAVEIVGDLGVIDRVGQDKLDDYAAQLADTIRRGAEPVAKLLASFAPALAAAMPRAADDQNELPDTPITVGTVS